MTGLRGWRAALWHMAKPGRDVAVDMLAWAGGRGTVARRLGIELVAGIEYDCVACITCAGGWSHPNPCRHRLLPRGTSHRIHPRQIAGLQLPSPVPGPKRLRHSRLTDRSRPTGGTKIAYV